MCSGSEASAFQRFRGGLVFKAHRLVQRFRGGLEFKAHRRVYRSTLGLRVINLKKKQEGGRTGAGEVQRPLRSLRVQGVGFRR